MDPTKFADTPFGSPMRKAGTKWAFWYYQPRPMPRRLTLEDDTVVALSRADAALGQLQGLGFLIKDPGLLIGPYLMREAVASSRIEGTQASLSDVLQAEASQEPLSEDVAEVECYLRANRLAYERIADVPISQRLLLEIHESLLDGVRGRDKNPGEFRMTPVWVGSQGAMPETAIYVPPLPEQVPDLLADWERFVNEPSKLPTLIQAGLMHYQFETIHPFLDGNGRIGRLIVNLLLKEQGRLDLPILYLSGYLEANRSDYYSKLQNVRERGEIQEWLIFFLDAIYAQAHDGVLRAGELVKLREDYLAEAMRSRSNLPSLVELFFKNPYLTVRWVERSLGLTNQGARNLIRQAEDRQWVKSLGAHGRGGREYWIAEDVLAILQAPAEYT